MGCHFTLPANIFGVRRGMRKSLQQQVVSLQGSPQQCCSLVLHTACLKHHKAPARTSVVVATVKHVCKVIRAIAELPVHVIQGLVGIEGRLQEEADADMHTWSASLLFADINR
jgi:hypothetical protein